MGNVNTVRIDVSSLTGAERDANLVKAINELRPYQELLIASNENLDYVLPDLAAKVAKKIEWYCMHDGAEYWVVRFPSLAALQTTPEVTSSCCSDGACGG